ncbi:MAG: FGGY family carbohydrate kinase [bacterium]|nr:FGGY family carbohydrate kinase [bacterium]
MKAKRPRTLPAATAQAAAPDPPVLVLDLGTASLRAVLVDSRGRAGHPVSRPWAGSLPGSSPGLIWRYLCSATREVLDRAGVDRVAAITVTGRPDGHVLLDGRGREIPQVPDPGSPRVPPEVSARAYRLTGHRSSAARERLWWLGRERPDVLKRAACFLTLPSWVVFRLAGEPLEEPSLASSSGLVELSRPAWSTGMFDELGLPPRIAPPLVRAGHRLALRPGAARHLGIAAGTPVVVAGAGSRCAAAGCGGPPENEAAAILGATAVVQVALDHPVTAPRRHLPAGHHLEPGRWALDSPAGPAGLVWEWFNEAFGPSSGDLAWRSGLSDHQWLEREAGQSPPGKALAHLGPTVWGERRSDRLALVFPDGPPPPVSRGAFARAILESIACAVRGNLEQLEEATGEVVKTVRVGGGMLRSRLLVSIVAGITGRSVIPAPTPETAAVGAAACAATGLGWHCSVAAAIGVMTAPGPPIPPDHESGAYEDLYRRWREFGGRRRREGRG